MSLGNTISEALATINARPDPGAAPVVAPVAQVATPVTAPVAAPATQTTGPVVPATTSTPATPVTSDPLDPTTPVTPTTEPAATPTTPAATPTTPTIPTLPVTTPLDTAISDLLAAPADPATPTLDPTTPTPAPISIISIDTAALKPDINYPIPGDQLRAIYESHQAVQAAAEATGIDVSTPDGIATINDLFTASKRFDSFIADLKSPTDVDFISREVIRWDPEGGIANQIVDSLFRAAPDVQAQFAEKLSSNAIVQALGETYKTFAGSEDDVKMVRASVKWMAHALGLDMTQIEAVTPKPKLTPIELENIRLKRDLEQRNNRELTSKAQSIHNTAAAEVKTTVESGIDNYLKTLVPSLFEQNIPPHLTKLRNDVTLDLRAKVKAAIQSDPKFQSELTAVRDGVNRGSVTDPQQVVGLFKSKVERILNPRSRVGTFYDTVSSHVLNAKKALNGHVTQKVAAATQVAAAPVTAASGTPVVKPDMTPLPGESPTETRLRNLRALVQK